MTAFRHTTALSKMLVDLTDRTFNAIDYCPKGRYMMKTECSKTWYVQSLLLHLLSKL